MKNIETTLEEIGFKKSEIKIYLSLLRLGEAKVGSIIKASGVSSSNTHDCLDRLLNKGVISFILKNNIKYFYPTKPNALKSIIRSQEKKLKEKKENLNEIIPILNNITTSLEISQGAEIFIGFNGIKNAYAKLCDPIVKKEKALFFHSLDGETNKIVHEFYNKFDIDKKYINISSKGIASKDYKKYASKRNTHVKIKYTELPIPSNINIYGDKTLLISWSKNPVGFLIKSKQITKTFKKLFEDIWDNNMS